MPAKQHLFLKVRFVYSLLGIEYEKHLYKDEIFVFHCEFNLPL